MIKDITTDRTLEYLSGEITSDNPDGTGLLIHTYRDGQWVDVDIADATNDDLDMFVTVYPKLTAQWMIILARYIRDYHGK